MGSGRSSVPIRGGWRVDLPVHDGIRMQRSSNRTRRGLVLASLSVVVSDVLEGLRRTLWTSVELVLVVVLDIARWLLVLFAHAARGAQDMYSRWWLLSKEGWKHRGAFSD